MRRKPHRKDSVAFSYASKVSETVALAVTPACLSARSTGWILSTPTFSPPSLPLRRPPAMMGTMLPRSMPIRREKKRSTCWVAPNWTMEQFSMTNRRYAGKKSVNRVRLTRSSGAYT